MDYWRECIDVAFDDAGIEATDEQKELVAGAVEGAHQNYGMAYGHDCIPNPLRVENDRLSRRVKWERERVVCGNCKGRGRIITVGPYHSSDSECWKCRGDGKVHPRGEGEPS